jgi:hypothetical protein
MIEFGQFLLIAIAIDVMFGFVVQPPERFAQLLQIFGGLITIYRKSFFFILGTYRIQDFFNLKKVKVAL